MLEADPLQPVLAGPAHVPGQGTKASHVALDALKQPCPADVSDGNWAEAAPYRHGIALYDAGYFWEAHEVWEPVWLATRPNSRERHLLAGLIQLANACLKLRMERWQAARRLIAMAQAHVGEAGGKPGRPVAILMGLDLMALAQSITGFRVISDGCGGDLAVLLPVRPRVAAWLVVSEWQGATADGA